MKSGAGIARARQLQGAAMTGKEPKTSPLEFPFGIQMCVSCDMCTSEARGSDDGDGVENKPDFTCFCNSRAHRIKRCFAAFAAA